MTKKNKRNTLFKHIILETLNTEAAYFSLKNSHLHFEVICLVHFPTRVEIS
jgi:hypothetical protein